MRNSLWLFVLDVRKWLLRFLVLFVELVLYVGGMLVDAECGWYDDCARGRYTLYQATYIVCKSPKYGAW